MYMEWRRIHVFRSFARCLNTGARRRVNTCMTLWWVCGCVGSVDVGKCVNLLGIEWYNDAIDYTNHAYKWYSVFFFFVKFQWFIFCPKGERVKFVILSSVYIQTQYCNAPTSYIVGWPDLAQSVERWVFKLKGPEFESSSDPSSCSMSQKVPNSRRIYVLCIRSSIITKWFSGF